MEYQDVRFMNPESVTILEKVANGYLIRQFQWSLETRSWELITSVCEMPSSFTNKRKNRWAALKTLLENLLEVIGEHQSQDHDYSLKIYLRRNW